MRKIIAEKPSTKLEITIKLVKGTKLAVERASNSIMLALAKKDFNVEVKE